VVVEAYKRPEIPYDAGPEAAGLGATSMIDVSDGLVADVGHIASASEVVIDLQGSAFEIPDPIAAVGAAVGVDPLDLVLTGGDDHALVATYPSTVTIPETWTVVGSVLEAPEGHPAGAVLLDGEAYAGAPGFRHF
jgi:thiamine-monophosphate kinase